MPSDKLTELGLRKAKPSSKPKKLSDGGGLFPLLHPSGSNRKQLGSAEKKLEGSCFTMLHQKKALIGDTFLRKFIFQSLGRFVHRLIGE